MMIENTLQNDFRIVLISQFFITKCRMHSDIFQFLDQKRIPFLPVNISCKFQFANIMKHSCNGKLITEFFFLPQFLCHRIRKITDSNSVIQFGRQVKFQKSVCGLYLFFLRHFQRIYLLSLFITAMFVFLYVFFLSFHQYGKYNSLHL